MGGVLVVLLMFFVFVTIRVSSPELKTLYADLSNADASTIASTLQSANVSYDISPDGTKILVPEAQVEQARMILAQEGLPQGGSMGYEIFDKQTQFGTTTFIQNINQVRALQGELSRTVKSLQQIKTARVHLVLPQRKLFTREEQTSSASVFIGLQPGAQLKPEHISSIQFLVSSAVAGLESENVSIIDGEGNLLARGGEGAESNLTRNAEEHRRGFEQRMTQTIEDIIGRVVGYSSVRANVSAEMNFDRVSTNEELYDPEGQVVRSTQTVEENTLERDPISGQVSVENNLPGVGGDILADQKPVQEGGRTEEVTNFEISKTVRTTLSEGNEVKRISVAVLIDGTYAEDADGNRTYSARSDQELQQIEALVKSAVGFDGTRGDTLEVINMQFVDVDTGSDAPTLELLLGFERDDLLDALEVIAVAVMIVLIILLIVQPMLARVLSAGSAASIDSEFEAELLAGGGAAGALEAPGGMGGALGGELEHSHGLDGNTQGPADENDSMINVTDVEGKVKESSVKKVEDIVQNYPNETVSVIRSWMTSET